MAGPNDYEEPVDGTGDGSTEVVLGNKYAVGNDNVINTREDASTKTDLDSSTGSGIEAAVGTQYSWNTNAADRANMAYQSDVLTAKQNYLQQRQNIEQQGKQMQTQYDMAQYSNNQSSEKVGWTGGYALDEKRQMDYLKSTIQSQMYGSMELQKYGYDTSLAAARLAYDTNKYDLALEYYNTALSRAVTEAELTGVYVSPEANEMKSQFFAAEEKLKENPNDENAQRVKEATKNWFESNNISEQGIYTFNALIELNTLYDSMWATIEDTYKDTGLYQLGSDTFINVNATKQDIAMKGFDAFKINFNTMSEDDIITYLKSDPTGRASEQFLSTLDSAGDTMATNIISKLKDVGALYETTTESGEKKYTTVHTGESITNLIYSYLSAELPTIADEIQKKLDRFSEGNLEYLEGILSTYEYTISLGENLPSIKVKILEDGKTSLTTGAADWKENNKDAPSGSTIPDSATGGLASFETKEDLFKNLTNINTENLLKDLPVSAEEVGDIVIHGAWSGIPTVAGGVLFGPIGLGVGAVIGGIMGAILQEGREQQLKDTYNDINTLRNNYIETLGGKDNIKLLKELKTKYNDMSEEAKANLTDYEKERYKLAIRYYDVYKQIDDVYKDVELYSDVGDSTGEKIGENWERYADGFKKIQESDDPNWQKGLNYVTHGIGGFVGAVGATIEEGFEWLF